LRNLRAVFLKGIVLLVLCFVVARPTFAGDAIAIGYNYDGVWTAVTYNRSSTPKGGAHYHDASKACEFALRDLRARASEDLVRTEIVGQSDRTGYVAVVRGTATARDTAVTAVGRGKSQAEADSNALKVLSERDATTEEAIVYRYFSYGADSGRPSNSKHSIRRIATSATNKRRT
jgi:hypothetical protein